MISAFFAAIVDFFTRLPEYFTKNPKELVYDWMGGNDVIFLGINSIRDGQYDRLMQAISWIGEHEHFIYYMGALIGWVLLSALYKLARKKSVRYYLTGWLAVFMVLGTGYAANGLVINTAKDYFAYPRPYVALASTGEVYKLEASEPQDDFRSFPSGHVSFTLFMVMALWPILGKRMAWFGVGLIVLMAWSRISLGMHFPADVLGSILITAPLMMLVRSGVHILLRKVLRIKC